MHHLDARTLKEETCQGMGMTAFPGSTPEETYLSFLMEADPVYSQNIVIRHKEQATFL
jgi:hypothetical protein